MFFTEFLFQSISICLIYQLYNFEGFRPSVTDKIGIQELEPGANQCKHRAQMLYLILIVATLTTAPYEEKEEQMSFQLIV